MSKHLRQATYDIFGIKKEIKVIYNFVDTDVFKPGKNLEMRRHFAPDDHRILIHASNFRPVKRVLDTIKAFNLIRKEIPSVLLMVGEGPDYYPAQLLVSELGICDKVKFLGSSEEIETLLPLADLFVMNSIKESFGLSVLEAASCGVPAIVTNVGGLPEVVEDGITGLIVEPGNVEGMAKQAVELFNNQDLLRKMGENARKKAVGKFKTDLIVPEYEKFYERVLSV